MHRKPLLHLLKGYWERYPDDRKRADRIRAFVESHEDCFERSCRVGHITGSAWIVSADHGRVLLTHHRKLERWLQLGGHADGDSRIEEVALREAREESGLEVFEFFRRGARLPIDIDVHAIPAHGDEPEHHHYDVRFLLIAAPNQALQRSPESKDLRWFSWVELDSFVTEESLLRMAHRSRAELSASR